MFGVALRSKCCAQLFQNDENRFTSMPISVFLRTINPYCLTLNQCRLQIAFENSLDPDQARQNVGPDLDPKCLSL